MPITRWIQIIFLNNMAVFKPNKILRNVIKQLLVRKHMVHRFQRTGYDRYMDFDGFLRSPSRTGKDHDITHHTRLRIARDTEPIGSLLGIIRKPEEPGEIEFVHPWSSGERELDICDVLGRLNTAILFGIMSHVDLAIGSLSSLVSGTQHPNTSMFMIS